MNGWIYPFTQVQMDAWKLQYKTVYVKQIGDDYFVYRPLSTTDFRKIRAEEYQYSKQLELETNLDDNEKFVKSQDFTAELVVKTCVLFPDDYASNLMNYGAGVIEQLNALIFTASGYVDTDIEPIKF